MIKFVEETGEHMEKLLFPVLEKRAEIQKVEIEEEEELEKIISNVNSAFRKNSIRLATEYFKFRRPQIRRHITFEELESRDVAISIANYLADRTIANALFENRRQILASDFILGLLDLSRGKVDIYPWD